MIKVKCYILYLMLILMIQVNYFFYCLALISITCFVAITLIIFCPLALIRIGKHLGGSCFGTRSLVCAVIGLCSIGLSGHFLAARRGVGLASFLVSEPTALSFLIAALFGYCTS